MSIYPPRVLKRLRTPRFAGSTGIADAVGKDVRLDCGSWIEVRLRIDAEEKRVTSVRFRTTGCGYLVAAADQLAEVADGKKLAELLWNEAAATALEGLFREDEPPLDRRACLDAASGAFKNAFEEYRRLTSAEYVGDSPLICSCFGVSEETITDIIAAGASTPEQVADVCNAGNGCGSCMMLISEIVESETGGPFGSRNGK